MSRSTKFRRPGAIRAMVCAAALALLVPQGGVGAEPLPQPETIAVSPAERAVLRQLSDLMVGGQQGDPLPALDRMLAMLPNPTQLRGLVQHLRALVLLERDRRHDAIEPNEESIRLLPGYSAPLLTGFAINLFADRPAIAAGQLMRASRIDPEIVRGVPDYELTALIRQLRARRDQRVVRQLAARLFEIGWTGSDLNLRSGLARELVVQRFEAGDMAGVREMLPRMVDPSDAHDLLIQSRFRALWPELEQWAGPRQTRQWRIYLTETAALWRATREPTHARSYMNALLLARHHDTAIREFLPLFLEGPDRREDYDLVWIASSLAEALAHRGRWQDLDAMFARAARIWPLGLEANALNIHGNWTRFRLVRGDAAGALAGIDPVIAEAERRSGEITPGALGSMHVVRACALHELGRTDDAVQSIAVIRSAGHPTMIAALGLCLDRADMAREALLAGFEDEQTRDDVLSWMQPSDGPTIATERSRLLRARSNALRSDPLLLAAVARHGRILPYALSEGAPPESAD